jgi:hypothetical protein
VLYKESGDFSVVQPKEKQKFFIPYKEEAWH